MKLTKRTTPQARDYQCDECKNIHCHKDMKNERFCYDCYQKLSEEEEQIRTQ